MMRKTVLCSENHAGTSPHDTYLYRTINADHPTQYGVDQWQGV